MSRDEAKEILVGVLKEHGIEMPTPPISLKRRMAMLKSYEISTPASSGLRKAIRHQWKKEKRLFREVMQELNKQIDGILVAGKLDESMGLR